MQTQNLNFDNYYLTPVPITQKKLLHRGFNQTNILAQAINQTAAIPIADILIKIKDTPDQVGLNLKERLENLKNSFNLKSLPPKNIILVDDIKTTGATLKECAETLKKAGAKNIIALTIA
ncbi:MAG: hypothetical protein KatS3mg097_468 [Candidatus Parcubacteria bacterium]|nr:MAG: hypothetical protein KatS3mg097_468 [Candidatus Parcubacteria bacterium]